MGDVVYLWWGYALTVASIGGYAWWLLRRARRARARSEAIARGDRPGRP